MRLKKIEILGFKSFKEKTVLAFSSGISAIVGPNGCGKSNIVDAMRWVMGEQRVTTLRGKKMEDVIFNGSDESLPVGMAEVSMTFENNGQSFNNAYAECAEVTVKRILYRDGISEYSINQAPCRLLDVREFFLDAGIGTRTYSIVEQERIFRLIEAKPEERREFIEEAAGIAKYRTRKESAVRKMEATRQNLLRLNDIVSEVKSRLNAISRQAKKAERFKALKQSIRDNQLTLSLNHLLGLKNRQESLDAEHQSLEDRRIAAQARLASLEASAEELRSRVSENEARATSAQEQYFTIKNTISIEEQQIEFSRKTKSDLEQRQGATAAETESLQARRKSLEAEKSAVEQEHAASEGSILEARRRIGLKQDALNIRKSEEAELRERLDQERGGYMEVSAERGRLKNLLLTLEKEIETLEKRKEREQGDISANHQRLATLQERRLELEAELGRDRGEHDDSKTRGIACREALETERRGMALLVDDIESLKEEAGAKSSRLRSLREIQESFDWCTEGTRSVLRESRKTSWEAGRVYGLVADQIEVAPEYETAVEAALGERIQSILVQRHEDGLRAIEYLKDSGAGRSSFIPLEGGRPAEPKQDMAAYPHPARPLSDIVRPRREEMQECVHRLFEGMLLIPNLATGTELWKQNGFTGTFVTPEGDIVSANGILTGGSTADGVHSLLRNTREINELTEQIEALKAELSDRNDARRDSQSRIESLEEELEQTRKLLHEKELRISEKKKDIERVDGEMSWIEQQLKILTFNTASMERETEEALRRIDESRGEMAGNEARLLEDQGRIAALQDEWKQMTERLQREEKELVEEKIALTSLEERRESGRRTVTSLEDSISDIDRRIEAARDESRRCAEQISQIDETLALAEQRLAGLLSDYDRSADELSEAKDRHEAMEGERQEREAETQEARKGLEAVTASLNRLTLDRQEVTMQMAALKTGVEERYHRELPGLISEFQLLVDDEKEQLEHRLSEDKKRLEEFGEVNLLALSEYEELQQRHEFLTTQTADLESSLETLQKTISRINAISRKRFSETYHAVNEKFQAVFPRLFPGGRGLLRLTDESDMLETGVDVEIQIPGKKPQNLSLLSGGEKALAAVSLIFAILLFRPTPFLVLDEADAPLDDSNISLFTRLVGEIAQDSQIIYITHNKRTMETADNLIGVTMHRSGISSIVSVNMH